MFNTLVVFVVVWLYRYVRLIVNCLSHWTFRPIPIPEKPLYNQYDVTVIIPTLFDEDTIDEIRGTVQSCLQTDPAEIIIVTIDSSYSRALAFFEEFKDTNIRLLTVEHANKRLQMCKAIPQVRTDITILVDDDVTWPSTLLPWILAPFEDTGIGGVGTSQRLHRAKTPTLSQRIWGFLGAIYLERRNFDISACTHMDGGLPCLSGRTVAYRTEILQDQYFLFGFTHETWRTYLLNADDDNFMTRWLVNHGWKTYIQYHKQAEVRTTLEDNPKFWWQCLRWARSNWRSNWKSLFIEGNVWSQQPWSTYAVQITTLTAWALFYDPLMIFLLYKGTEDWPQQQQHAAIVALICWIVMSKTIKLVGHFARYPEDILMLPISWSFSYLHSLIKLIAMFTLHETAWGSRANADTGDNARMIPLPKYE